MRDILTAMSVIVAGVLLSIVPLASGQGLLLLTGNGPNGGGGGGGPTLQDSNTNASTGSSDMATAPSQDWYATKFVAGSNYTLTSFDLYLENGGTASGTLTPYVYSHVSDSPDTSLGSGTAVTINLTNIPASETAVNFSGLSVALTSGTTYWLVVFKSTVGSGTDVVKWHYNTNIITGPVQNMMRDGDGAGTWANHSSSFRGKFKTYSGS